MLKISVLAELLTRSLLAVVLTSSLAMATSLSGPVTFGSPDQPFGSRRPVTAADRALILSYRSKVPVFATTFSNSQEIQRDWLPLQDDQASLRSCRRPDNLEASKAGVRFKTLVAADCHAHWSTGSMRTKVQYTYGFFEATMKIADIRGMNNAFWLTTQDHYEIDVGEVQFPNYSHIGLQYWPTNKREKHAGVGFGAHFRDDLSRDFHDVGLLWTPREMIFEVDGEPVAALVTNDAVKGPANVWLSAALADWASGPVPEHPEGHGMVIKSLRIIGL